ncbi:type II secretion system protein GspG [Comamonas sp. JC664]|uniref:type II secretion system protein GspG n=1 Tax=Comamonas sp. JC664 TaxID=2801917 RepID=UPI00191CFD47|nr:type II secretion system protein GspG [Comamonas sp. JC664]MBL0694464.1 type II secretion system protein GspG [Comamonas sp. JC664]GHG77704.1 type II secretion system protein GspG [Comamonas sp. KCTC 72670]
MKLFEFLIFFGICGLISAAVAVSVLPSLYAAKVDRAMLDLGALDAALKLHHRRTGDFPDTSSGLKALVASGAIERLPVDPWGRDYAYLNEGGSPVVLSYGSDGVAGGDRHRVDIALKVEPPPVPGTLPHPP